MNNSSSLRLRFALVGLVLSAFASLPARAVTFATASFATTTSDVDNLPDTVLDATLGTFDFGAANLTFDGGLKYINFSIKIGGLDTVSAGSDFNNISLALDGIDTGLKLNGSNNSISSGSAINFSGRIQLSDLSSQAIMNALLADNKLVASLLDITSDPANEFRLFAGTSSITAEVPFSPAQSLGLAVLGVVAGAQVLRRRKMALAA